MPTQCKAESQVESGSGTQRSKAAAEGVGWRLHDRPVAMLRIWNSDGCAGDIRASLVRWPRSKASDKVTKRLVEGGRGEKKIGSGARSYDRRRVLSLSQVAEAVLTCTNYGWAC